MNLAVFVIILIRTLKSGRKPVPVQGDGQMYVLHLRKPVIRKDEKPSFERMILSETHLDCEI